MIPKKLHYCWFGGKPLNEMGRKCLESWKRYFPDYEIIEWNENNFDVSCCQYVKEAYEAKKWAFVSDYARYKILYEQGGVYFDTDVEVIASFEDIIAKGSFMGSEIPAKRGGPAVNPGLGLGTPAGLPFVGEILADYEKSSFYKEDGSLNLYTIVERTTALLKQHGLEDSDEIQTVADITVYPVDYFAPVDMETGKLKKTANTRSIHHYAASWVDGYSRFRGRIYKIVRRICGDKLTEKIRGLVGRGGKS